MISATVAGLSSASLLIILMRCVSSAVFCVCCWWRALNSTITSSVVRCAVLGICGMPVEGMPSGRLIAARSGPSCAGKAPAKPVSIAISPTGSITGCQASAEEVRRLLIIRPKYKIRPSTTRAASTASPI